MNSESPLPQNESDGGESKEESPLSCDKSCDSAKSPLNPSIQDSSPTMCQVSSSKEAIDEAAAHAGNILEAIFADAECQGDERPVLSTTPLEETTPPPSVEDKGGQCDQTGESKADEAEESGPTKGKKRKQKWASRRKMKKRKVSMCCYEPMNSIAIESGVTLIDPL